jgi:hypothetical protein
MKSSKKGVMNSSLRASMAGAKPEAVVHIHQRELFLGDKMPHVGWTQQQVNRFRERYGYDFPLGVVPPKFPCKGCGKETRHSTDGYCSTCDTKRITEAWAKTKSKTLYGKALEVYAMLKE